VTLYFENPLLEEFLELASALPQTPIPCHRYEPSRGSFALDGRGAPGRRWLALLCVRRCRARRDGSALIPRRQARSDALWRVFQFSASVLLYKMMGIVQRSR